jgi:hypothetical protein
MKLGAIPATTGRGPTVPLLLAIGCLPLLVVALFRVSGQVTIPDMVRDVSALTQLHPLAGAMSTLGILAWWSSATIWLFAASQRCGRSDRESVRFLAYSGLLSAWLALDDQFQLHETLIPDYLGVSQDWALLLLSAATVTYLLRFRRAILASGGRCLLLFALVLLFSSLVVDSFLIKWMWRLRDWKLLVEDGLKWLGIVFWLGFCVAYCRVELLGPEHGDATT